MAETLTDLQELDVTTRKNCLTIMTGKRNELDKRNRI